MLNRFIVTGRLVRDPDYRTTPDGKSICNFRIAVEHDRVKGKKPESSYFGVVSWGKTADFVQKYFAQGQSITIDGKVKNNLWKDKNGIQRENYEITAEYVYFCGELKRKDQTKSTESNAPTPSEADDYPEGESDQVPF